MQTWISQRVSALEPSPTLAVDAKAKAMRAAGENVIGFGAGEPDFATPAHIVEAARQAALDPATHKYSPSAGLPELRSAIAEKTSADLPMAFKASQVVVTNGAKQAVFNALASIIDPGDEVIYATPVWSTYTEVIKLVGGIPVPVKTTQENNFHLHAEDIERATTDRTKALLVVSPSNPTGAVLDEQELNDIAQLALDRHIMVITDEIYEHLTYEGHRFTSILKTAPALAEQAIIINGVSKSFAMTGWRVGWMVGPQEIITAVTDLQSQTTSNVANIAQRAALAALQGGVGCIEEMRAAFEKRREIIYGKLSLMPGVTITAPEGAFYAFPDVSKLIGREIHGNTLTGTTQLAQIALDTVKVAVVPGEAFEAPGYLRLSYALSDEMLSEGLDRLHELFASAV
jgi:aspartate/methionine/tyrosine aminotransferase